MGKRDISTDGQVRQPDPFKWETPHDYGEGKHAGKLEQDNNNNDEQAGDND